MRAQGGRRDVGVDVVRGLAIASMYVAHVAPFDAPLILRDLSNLLTAALFAVLVGVGFGLSPGRRTPRWAAPLVRGAALIVLGFALTHTGSFVIVILIHLGLLTWLMALLDRAPTVAVAGVGATLFVVSPMLRTSLADEAARLGATGPGWQATLLDLAATGDSYRLTALLAWACLGYLVARLLRQGWHPAVYLFAGAAVLVVVVSMVIRNAPAAGRWVVPYSGTHAELAINAGLACGVLVAGVGLSRLMTTGLDWLVEIGQMSLTLYSLQVLALAFMERVLTGQSPVGWLVLALLMAGSVAFVNAWNAVPALRRWGRGPLEGAVERLVRWVRPLSRSATSRRPHPA